LRGHNIMTSSCSQSPPTHDGAAEFEERLVYVRSALVAHTQTSELMQPSDRARDSPASGTQAAAVFGVAAGKQRIDAAISQRISMRLRIVAAIPLHQVGFVTRAPQLAGDRWNSIHQRQQLGNVVAVGFGKNDAQR